LHLHYKNLHFTYRVFSYTYFMTYSSGFVIIIPDKTIISVVSWHQMDTQLVLETQLLRTNDQYPRLVMGTRLLFETRLLLEVLW